MRSEGFPFIVWGSGPGAGPVFASCAPCRRGLVVVSSRSRRRVVVVSSLIPCRGDWRRGVLRAGMVDMRFAWQAPGARPRSGRHWRVDPRGRCRETCIWTLVGRCRERWPPEVSRTWIRVAGVGKRARSVRFAWQAWGMVRPVASLGIVLRGRRREWCVAAETVISWPCARNRLRWRAFTR